MRYRIGVFLSTVYESVQNLIWQGIQKELANHGVDLWTFVGSSQSQFTPVAQHYHLWQSLLEEQMLDGAIFFTGNLNDHLSIAEIESLFQKSKTPTISLFLPLLDCPTISVDPRPGIENLIHHLILNHTKDIGFLKGPNGQFEAEERLQAFRDAMASHNIEVPDSWIFEGDFSKESGVETLRTIHSQQIPLKALVTVDDHSALGAISEAQKLGYHLPEDLIICGFDDIEEAQFSSPSLTTIAQPFDEMGSEALRSIVSWLNSDVTPVSQKIPTQLVLRTSCNCHPFTIMQTNNSFSEINLGKHFNLYNELEQTLLDTPDSFQLQLWQNIQLHPEMSYAIWLKIVEQLFFCIPNHHPKHLFIFKTIHDAISWIHTYVINEREVKTLKQETLSKNIRLWNRIILKQSSMPQLSETFLHAIQDMDFRWCTVVLYEMALRNTSEHEALPTYPCKVWLHHQKDHRSLDYTSTNFLSKQLLPKDLLEKCQNYNLTMLPIFSDDWIFGYMLLDPPSNWIGEDFEDIRLAIGQAMHKIQDLIQLHTYSYQDELTGLFNRRAFFEKVPQIRTQSLDTTYYVVYADLDGLKPINDTYGHKQGDLAIRVSSQILNDFVEPTDIIARIGGDEFVIFMTQLPQKYIKRVQQQCLDFNKTDDFPFDIGISMGHEKVLKNDTIEKALIKADKKLYRQKQRK